MMRGLQHALSRLTAVFHRDALDRDFDEELAAHLDLLTEQNQQRGMAPEEARRHAVLKMGGIQATRELHRDTRGLPRLEDLAQISAQALRSWRSAKTVGLLAALALTLGIGAAASIYTIVNAVMLRPLPYKDGSRFVALFESDSYDSVRFSPLVSTDARKYQELTTSFDAFGWFRDSGKNVMFAGEPDHVRGVMVTRSLVAHLGVEPALGRWFQDASGAVISSTLWRRLGGDPAIVGRPIALDGQSFTITGVMPESFHLPVGGATSAGQRFDVWMPLDPNERAGNAYTVYARRKPGVTFATAAADVRRVAAIIAAEDPGNHEHYAARLFDLRETVISRIRPTLLLLFAAAGLLFLVACATAAGLLLARSVARARETAVRVALGAARGQLWSHHIAEGLLIAVAGAVGGTLVSFTLTPGIVSLAADYLPRAHEIAVDWTVLSFALVSAVLATLLSSVAPLWHASRTAPADVLGDGVRASAGGHSRRLSQSLVIGEIGLAFALLAVSVILGAHLRHVSRTSPGFDADEILSFSTSLPTPAADDAVRRVTFQATLLETLREIHGVERVAFANHLPLKDCCTDAWIFPDGHPREPAASSRVNRMAVSADYFAAMGIPLRSGRFLTDSDVVVKPSAIPIMVNEAAARQYWAGDDPVGSGGHIGDPKGPRFHVVGVAADVKNKGLDHPADPDIYSPAYYTRVEGMRFVIRSSRSPASLIPEIRRAVSSVDPEQPVYDIATMREVVGRTMILERAASFLTGFFAAAALLMAVLGVYGVVAYSVRQRTVEFGVRLAMGASWGSVLSLVVGSGLKLAAWGLLIGGLAAMAAASYIARAFGLGDIGPAPFLYSAAPVAAVACGASLVPAWRATLLSPLVAIRQQR
jgi:predicted permease